MSGIRSTGGLTIPELSRRVSALRSPSFRSELSQVLAAAAGKLINDGFRDSVDPYGRPWAPLKYRKGQPLLKTGRGRASFTSRPLANGFRIDATARYMIFHQKGTKPHQRAARAAATNARGRFISRQAAGRAKRSVRVSFIPAHAAGGIPQRQMVPMAETGGLPATWVQTFNRDTDALVQRIAKRGA